MKIYFTWDDGSVEDQKLFDLHYKYNVPGMFFVPTLNSEGRDVLSPAIMRCAESNLISFGGHTEHHLYLTDIPQEQIEPEIRNNKVFLEDVLGHEIKHFCLPGGKYNRSVLDVVYKYYSAARTADTLNFKSDKTLIKPTFHIYPRGYKSMLGNAVRNKSTDAITYLLKNPREKYFSAIYHLIRLYEKTESQIVIWGHSWEIEELNLWPELNELMKVISENYSNEECQNYNSI